MLNWWNLNVLHKVKFWMATRSEYKLRFNVYLCLCNSKDEMCCGELCILCWIHLVGDDSFATSSNEVSEIAKASKIILTWERIDFIWCCWIYYHSHEKSDLFAFWYGRYSWKFSIGRHRVALVTSLLLLFVMSTRCSNYNDSKHWWTMERLEFVIHS